MNRADRTDRKLQRAVETIVDRFDPSRVILFGSRARGEAGSDSDYDLLVLFDREIDDRLELTVQIRTAISGAGFAKDVVVMSESEYAEEQGYAISIGREAAREGEELYSEKPAAKTG